MEQFVGLSGAALRCSEVNLGALGPAFQWEKGGRSEGDLGTLGAYAAVWAI